MIDDDIEERQKKLRKYLAPLPNDKLIELMVKIGSEYPQAFDEVEKVAQQDTAHRKLFVRGLPWEFTKEALSAAFATFGEIEEANVVTDKATGKTKGYGFLLFKDMDSAYNALGKGTMNIQGRTVHLNLAALRMNPTQTTQDTADTTMRKVFIRGLAREWTADDIKTFLSQYGEIEEANVAMDKESGQNKGYGFVTYLQAASATAALEQPHKEWNGRTIHCNLAALGANKTPKAENLQRPAATGIMPASNDSILGPAAQAMAIAAARRNQQAFSNQMLSSQQQAYSNFGALQAAANAANPLSTLDHYSAAASAYGLGLGGVQNSWR